MKRVERIYKEWSWYKWLSSKDGKKAAGGFALFSVGVSQPAREERANEHQVDTSCVKRVTCASEEVKAVPIDRHQQRAEKVNENKIDYPFARSDSPKGLKKKRKTTNNLAKLC